MNLFNKKKPRGSEASHAVILDTCALIDGRIVPIIKAGFVSNHIVIPQFVIAELQYLADNGDSQKRERARFGLDVIRELQGLGGIEVAIAREQFKNIKEVDDKLVALARQYGSMLYTTDYNLNKVAQIEGVRVLNVNELAQALRPPRLPGEQAEVKITQLGQDRTQGVAYLEDGTMVVVEQAGKLVGQRIRVQFSRILQTQAGKMMFAVLLDKPHIQQPAPQVASKPQVAHFPAVGGHNKQQQFNKPPQQPRPQKQPQSMQQHNHAAPQPQGPKQKQQQPQPPRQQRPMQQAPQRPNANTAPRPQRPRRQDAEDSLLNAIRDQQ